MVWPENSLIYGVPSQSNWAVLSRALTEVVPTATILYNGHGEPTTVEHEKKFNYIVGDNAGGEFIFP